MRISLIVASIFHISAVYGPIGLCFGYDAPIGTCYHNFRAHDPIDRFRGPLLRGRLFRQRLLSGCLLRGLLFRERLFWSMSLEWTSLERMSLERRSH